MQIYSCTLYKFFWVSSIAFYCYLSLLEGNLFFQRPTVILHSKQRAEIWKKIWTEPRIWVPRETTHYEHLGVFFSNWDLLEEFYENSWNNLERCCVKFTNDPIHQQNTGFWFRNPSNQLRYMKLFRKISADKQYQFHKHHNLQSKHIKTSKKNNKNIQKHT